MTAKNALVMAAGLEDHAYEQVSTKTEILTLRLKTGQLPYQPLDGHPDVFAMECGTTTLISPQLDFAAMVLDAPELRRGLTSLFTNKKLVVGDTSLGHDYPHTCAYNAIVYDRWVIGNLQHLEPKIAMAAKENQLSLLGVRQGYSRCSCFTVGDKVLVTSDLGIAKRVKRQIDLLKSEGTVIYCSPTGIRLRGFSHGFLGGTTWKLDPGRRYFYGDVTRLPIWPELRDIFIREGIEPVYKRDKVLEDVGSAINIHY